MQVLKELLILNFIALAFGEIIRNRLHIYRWDLFIKGKASNNNIRVFCRISMITPQVFLTSASCINGALLSNPNQRLTTYTSSFRSIEINENNIYYHEDFSETYDKSKRDIAMVIISQPIITNKIMIFTLPNNTADVDYSSCFNSINEHEFHCASPINKSFGINQNITELSCSETTFTFAGEPIICSLKEYPNDPVLVGFQVSSYKDELDNIVKIINTNIGDLTKNIKEKLSEAIYYF